MKYDDFWTSYGTIVTDPVEFGNSWKVDPTCENATAVDHPCDANPERRLIARENCSTLLKPPFSNCSSYINATEEGYIAGCEYDMCACEDDPVVCYCQALEAYADDCSSNIEIDWMNLDEFAICSTPCASAPCYNGGSCTNVGHNSFECRCPAGFLGDRCEMKDLCQIPYLFLSTSLGTVSYKTENFTSIPMKVDDRVGALLSYDAINKRLYLYVVGEGITSYYLDGSDEMTTNIGNVDFFTVDGRNNLIYYYHKLHSRIYVYNITSGQSQGTEVDALSDISSVKDLEMDMINGYLYIARAGDPPIVRYNPADKTIMEFNFDGSAQSISVDVYNNVIYWANYDGINHNVMKTSLNKQTIGLNISYPGGVDLTSDVLNLYVLDTSNNRVDKYLKTSSEKQGNFTYHVTINDLIIAYDHDECCAGTFCHVNSSCANSLGSFNCSCNEGFAGNGTYCEDVNECLMSNYCHENATCKNKIGSFKCDCDEGFIGDGRDCKATNCSLLSCGENEQCVRADDIFKCICKDDYEEPDCRLVKATCNARGDPHYSTFDGKLFDFMGKCEYVLAKDSVNNTFEIRQVNEECGNGEPSCTKSLTVMFPNVTIQLLRGSVTANGMTISLSTMYMANGVKISQPRSGITLVESDYGVEVEWNNVHNVRVTVFGRYLNRTSGLCGTYNRYGGDDLLMSNGTIADNEVEFGNSWKTDPDCEDATFVDHPCTTNPDRNATARANCSALRDSPFDKCSSYINPDSEGYISDCEYDVCACDDHPTLCLCQAIEAYVDDCASYGVNITWLSYPQYQQCTTPCASDPCFNGGTCTNIHSNFSCSCPVGFTGHRCEMKVDDCDDLSCGKNEVCVRVGDTFDCVCHQDYTGDDCKEKVEATCVTYGDPHYRTFDGKRFDFMGKCEYVLAKDRVNNTFEIRQENEPCGNGLVTCTKSITVIFPGLTIKLQRGMTNVNGGEISSSTNYGAVNVTIHGNGRTVVTSDYGVTVFWNNVYNVRVTIGGRYVNRTSGLCGTYNKMKYDDFWTPYGTIVGDPVEFGNSWKVDPTCENATTVDHPCDANLERRLIARENCSALLKPPFSNCSSYINATEEGYIADCEYDMCACEDDSVACYCQALQTYADDCSSDVKITWMNLEQFAICNTPCASAPCYNGGTCTDIDSSSFECRCPAGYIGARCENKDLCQIPYLFLSTSSGTVSYNTENSTSIPMKVDDRVNALLSYDAINRRLYLYDVGEGITSYYLDGSDEMTTNIGNVKLFTVDGRNNLMYYYHELHSRIYVYNITSGQSQGTEVDALKDISSVKDLEMDTTNGYLYIARAGDPPIVRYNPGDNTIMEFNFDGSAQSISVDEYNNVIYWANYDGINHNVMKTSLNKQTIGLNISYPGAVELTSDVLNLYVLDTSNNRIDKYLKTSSEKQGNFTYHVTINDLIIAYDHDECCAGTFCHVNSTCANSLGSFNCSCNEGFAGNGTYCEDVNECLMSNYCHENATCKNKIGSFECDCDEGFIGDGRDCKATNCSLLSCGENEQCVRADDIFKCICKDDYEEPDCRLVKATCNARGDPHYSTFDGKLFDFMGKCEYVLAKDSVNNTFEIRQVNEECGNSEPSCTKSLTVMFPNVTIQLLRGSVTVHGTTISLSTMYMANGVKISQPRSGITLVESDYGVEVEWNNVHNVRVTVFGRYLNRTSGLCGTYNRYRGDDFLMSNGTTTDNEVEFGNSWKTDPSCEDATFVDHPCTTNPDRNATARANCSALRDSPFDKCSSYINPDAEGYISDCEYDVCACDDHPTVCLCQAIEAYVDDCASYGVNITWLSYPQYQQCTTPCASDPCFNGGTCTNIHSNFSCSCPVGFTGHRCEMEVDDCDDLSCGENEVCVRVGDTFDCVCHQDYTGDDCKQKVEATCVTYGDPHYRTFDGKRFDFMGKCEYVLAKDRVNNTFEIRQENEPCGNGLVTCTKSITVIFPGLTIKLQRGMTNVNGGEISSSTNYGAVNVTIHGNGRTVVTSDYGVTVFWNNVYNVRVTIAGRYVNRTSGLCGTYNKMKYDDFWTPYGTIVGDPVEFGNSWKVDPTCENATTVDHPCDANAERRLIARENCSALLKPPFSNCSSYINATEEGYISDCEYDMCACEDDSVACYCQALQTYADDCSSDVKITWMNLEQFAICNTPCASAPCYNGGTCTDIDSSSFECRCPAGYIGARCENKDLCQIPYLFLSTSSGTVSYNTENSTSIPMKVDDRVGALLSYDAINRRLYLYVNGEGITSYYLDGSDEMTTNIGNVKLFTVNGRNNLMYYYHELHSRIYVYNITGDQLPAIEVDALKDISSVKDLEMDTTNGYLYIARAGDPPIVRYNPADNTIMEFNFDGSAQSISVDEYNNVIYWANYDGINHNVMKTSLNKQTIGLNISYPGAVELTSDVLNLYVLDTSSNRIDKYLKTSSEKQGNFTYHVTINDLIIAYDNDECCAGSFCHVNSSCANSLGSFNCSCNEGFAGNGTYCEDVNECLMSNYCHENATCKNKIGSFKCDCDEGFIGDGRDCKATNCSLLSCGENEQCVRADDIFKCICKDDYEEPDCRLVKATCNARGDPHYSTFDGKLFDFMGRCEYVLAKDSVNNTFEIRQVNEECGNGEPSCTKSLTVMFPNVTIQLLRGSVTANGMTISLSTMYMANGVKISQPRSGITLVESDYGVEVEWNNVHNVRVTVFGRYLNRTSGLCGTYNRYGGDDFFMSNGTITDSEIEFGNSWKTDPNCEDATFVDHP
ncbi:IgGFc-binding protein-like, partial [Dendronephthya gigantea]|uniref:IgGFc-binding protein-like n=1 Tax=Dendronephthya gigantea TaxID=151771 RepID=UPI001068F79C